MNKMIVIENIEAYYDCLRTRRRDMILTMTNMSVDRINSVVLIFYLFAKNVQVYNELLNCVIFQISFFHMSN